ncbi:hypothetical protein F5887DRAFT_341803 [Amanita rubescens]|nr:hypothetical protein F5887DRAFT_341803 [Amanita rubescens]
MLSEPERDQIVQYFFGLPSFQKSDINYFSFDLPEWPALFVKYRDGDLMAEATTQHFFHTLAQKDRSAPGIPAVYSAFYENGYHFIVMEKINLPVLGACNSIQDDYGVQRVASAVGWLLAQMPAIPNSLFGRISDSEACVWHAFFKGHKAPVPFISSEAVAKYVNKALSRCRGKMTLPISLSNDLSIYHSDIHEGNFLLDVATGRIWIVDFQHIGVFPKPFQQYAFFNIDNSFAAAVGRHLGYQPPDIAEAMMKASSVLQQIGGTSRLGLDKFGEGRPRDSTMQSV